MFSGLSVSNILIGLFMVIAGVMMVKFSFKLLTITGQQGWLEKFTGSGSTSGMYKVFGVALIFLGFMFASGFGASVMNFLFAPLKNIFNTVNGG